jgi:hypothetical protein
VKARTRRTDARLRWVARFGFYRLTDKKMSQEPFLK